MYDFIGQEIGNDEKNQYIKEFMAKYLDDKYPEHILIGNHLIFRDMRIPTESMRNIDIDQSSELILYHERLKQMFMSSFQSICDYVEQLEPWEDVDLVVFPVDLSWYICVTHDDEVILHGIDTID